MFPKTLHVADRDYALIETPYEKALTDKVLESAAGRLDLRRSSEEVLGRLERYIHKHGPVSGSDTIRGAFGEETPMGFDWDPFFETLRRDGKIARYKASNNRNLYLAKDPHKS